MRKQNDPRHKKRQKVISELFALSYLPQKKIKSEEIKKITENLNHIDQKISQAAPAFPLEKVSKIDLSILRLAVFELEEKTAPPKVVVNEAVELSKEFGGENSYSFVNGVLGTILKKYGFERS